MSKLLFLTSSFPRYKGDFAGNFVAEFAQAISTNYEEIQVLTPASKNYPKEQSWGKIKIIRFNYFFPFNYQLLDSAKDLQPLLETSIFAQLQLIPFCLVFFFRAFFLAKQADVICSHWLLPAGLIGSLLSFLLKKPHLIVEHSGALNLLCKLPIGNFVLNIIGKYAKSIVLVSKELQNKLIKLCPKLKVKTSVIAMGIDCNFYQPSIQREENKVKKILFLGRLAKIKGVDVLIKALAKCENIILLIAGDGEERETLEKLANNLQVPAKFLGTVLGEDKLKLIQSCDLLVIPSIILPDGRTEGTPVVCLEAFACGKAVIASNVGGLKDLIIDGKTGFLFEPENQEELREKIFALLNDDKKINEISSSVRNIALEYDWSIIAKQFNLLI
ncbi:MAG: glycosyltransferase family 4 protein [Acidobacteria bacterium]|nr:glycosyltransferase family 4 protein [Acidobacteriota bacterium]